MPKEYPFSQILRKEDNHTIQYRDRSITTKKNELYALLIIWLTLIFTSGFISTAVFSCPATILARDLVKIKPKQQLNKLKLFALHKNRWAVIPHQILPLTKNRKFKFSPEKKSDYEKNTALNKLVIFETDQFGRKLTNKLSKPCETNIIYEVAASTSKYAYFAFCNDTTASRIVTQSIIHNKKKREVKARQYLYRYNQDNHLMFETISLNNTENLSQTIIARNSYQLIRCDIKNFFTLNLEASDVEAKIEKEVAGPVGLLGRLSFFLKFLFFKIDLELAPIVLFYDNSVFMPMVMHIPVNAQNYLNSNSGLYYTWSSNDNITWDFKRSQIPNFNIDKIRKGYKKLAKEGLKYCLRQSCSYNIWGKAAQKHFTLNFNIPIHLVKQGFFPVLISNEESTEEDTDYKISSYDARGRMGVYFEASGLPKGGHNWEFWIRFAKDKKKLTKKCPHPIMINEIIHF